MIPRPLILGCACLALAALLCWPAPTLALLAGLLVGHAWGCVHEDQRQLRRRLAEREQQAPRVDRMKVWMN